MLTTTESQELAEYEETIERGLTAFVTVGAALAAIRDGRLYRANHAAFEDYCRERWGMARNYANKHIAAAEVFGHLGTNVPMLPANEAQARPLTALPPDQQAAAWERAVKTLPPGAAMTAGHVRQTVEREFLSNRATWTPELTKAYHDGRDEPYPPAIEDAIRQREVDRLIDLPTPHQRAAESPARRWQQAMHDVYVLLTSTRDQGGIGTLTRTWNQREKEAYGQELRRVIGVLDQWLIELETSDGKYDT